MNRETVPDEDTQTETYRTIVEELNFEFDKLMYTTWKLVDQRGVTVLLGSILERHSASTG